MKLKDVYVFWSVYFNSTLTRGEGRRLSYRFCIPNPTLVELENSCRDLGLKIVAMKEAKYPRIWFVKSFYAVVKKEGRKGNLMLGISKRLKIARSKGVGNY